jgi:hypothetical protein
MQGLWIVVGILGVWRVTYLLYAEDGPGGMVTRLRRWVGNGLLGKAMDCFDCLSLWVAVPFALLIGDRWLDRALIWPALSAGAMMANRALSRLMRPAAAVSLQDPYLEDPVEEVSDVQLRQGATESGDVEPDRHGPGSPATPARGDAAAADAGVRIPG